MKYITPKVDYVARKDFIALGPSLGFTYESKTKIGVAATSFGPAVGV